MKKGVKHKNSWGRYSKLKFEYANEFEQPIKEYKMDKEELEKYLRKLELKNRYKLGVKIWVNGTVLINY